MSVNYGGMSEEELIAPEYYFSGRKGIKSDLPWIKSNLVLLTLEQKKEVCEEYREIYLRQGRKEANTYLKSYVDANGCSSNVKGSMFASGRVPDALKARIERIKASRNKKSILGMAGE